MRLWFLVGCVWCVLGYVIYFRKDFTEKPVEWLYIASVSIPWIFFSVKLRDEKPVIIEYYVGGFL